MKKYFFLCLAYFFPQLSFAQNLTGTWIGVGNEYRMVLLQQGDSCFGYTYDTGMGYCKANFKGKYDSTEKKLKGLNPSFIERTLSHGLSSYRLTYAVYNNEEFLEGRVTPKSTGAKILSFGIGMPVRYRKLSEKIDTTAFIAEKLLHAASLLTKNTAPERTATGTGTSPSRVVNDTLTLTIQKNNRSTQVINSITTIYDSVKLVLFDNGEIDNDTVTVFLNGKIIIDRLGLKAKFFEHLIVFQPGDSVLRVDLMANNLGLIPPNTANLYILTGNQKYELKAASDYSRNAAIDIRKIAAVKAEN